MELKGKIVKKFDKVILKEKLEKSQLLLQTIEQYPKNILVDFLNKNADLIKSYNVNDSVIVKINISSREYNDKYYTSINGYNISHDIL